MEFIPQEEQMPPQQSPYGYVDGYQSPVDESKFNFMRWQLDTDSFLESIENLLKGMKKVVKDGESKWEKRSEDSKPMLNEDGISRVMTVIGARITKESMMSDLDEEKIAMIAKDCADDINDLLYMEGEAFDVKESDLSTIVNLIQDQIYTALRRSYKGGERRFISLVERAIEQMVTRVDTNPKQFSPMNPMTWGRKK